MTDDPPEPQVLEHLRVVARYRRVIAAVSLVLAGVVYLAQSAKTPIYVAQASVRFVVPEATSAGAAARESASLVALTYIETASGPNWAQRVVKAGATVDPAVVEARVSVVEQVTPGFLGVRAESTTAAGAVRLADAGAVALVALMRDDQQAAVVRTTQPLRAQLDDVVAQLGAPGLDQVTTRALADRRAQLQQSIAEREQLTKVVVLDPTPAVPPGGPASPRPLRNALAALVASAVLVSEALALYRYLRGFLPLGDLERSVERLVGVPVVSIDTVDAGRSGAIVPFVLEHLVGQRFIAVLQRGGRPDATAAREIADALARSGARVLLADTDVRSPMLHEQIGIPLAPGLVEVTSGARSLAPSVRALPQSRGEVAVLSAGALADANPNDVIGDARVPALLERSGADHAVLVSTSAVPLDDALLVAQRFPECVVLAVDAEHARRRDLREAARAVRAVGGNLTGAVCVRRPAPPPRLRAWFGQQAGRLRPPAAGGSAPAAPDTASGAARNGASGSESTDLESA